MSEEITFRARHLKAIREAKTLEQAKSHLDVLKRAVLKAKEEVGESKQGIMDLIECGLVHENKDIVKYSAKMIAETQGTTVMHLLLNTEMPRKLIHGMNSRSETEISASIVKPLIHNLREHDDKYVLLWSTMLLSDSKDKKALPALMLLTDHKLDGIKSTAKLAIKKIQEANRGKD